MNIQLTEPQLRKFSRWRNRSEFINGRNEIIAFLSRKWAKELNYRLIKELWAFTGNRIGYKFPAHSFTQMLIPMK